MYKSAPLPTTIRQLKDYYDSGRLNFHPDYQRDSDRWDSRRKQDLLFSIINSDTYTIQPVYFHSIKPKARQLQVFDVVDGKQRLGTILNFVNGRRIRRADGTELGLHPLRIGKEYAANLMATHGDVMEPLLGKTFTEMSQKEQDLFMDAKLDVVYMEDYDPRALRNVFGLMQTAKGLTPAEKVLSQNTPIVIAARELFTVYQDALGKQRRINQEGFWILGITEFIILAIKRDVDLWGQEQQRMLSHTVDDDIIEAARDQVSGFMNFISRVIDLSTLDRPEFMKAYKGRNLTPLIPIWMEKEGGFDCTPEEFINIWEPLMDYLPARLAHKGFKGFDLPHPKGREEHIEVITEAFRQNGVYL